MSAHLLGLAAGVLGLATLASTASSPTAARESVPPAGPVPVPAGPDLPFTPVLSGGGGGRSFVEALGESPTMDRDRALLAAVRAGFLCPIDWIPVPVSWKGHSGEFYAAADALGVGTAEDFVRFNVRHPTADIMAAMLGAVLPTPLMADTMWRAAAIQLEPCIQTPKVPGEAAFKEWSAQMANTSKMLEHNACVSAKLALAAGRKGLIGNAGKLWVTTERLRKQPGQAANYGWFDERANLRSVSGLPVWQSLGLAHSIGHTDYSQTVRIVRDEMLVDGKIVPVQTVMASSDLFGLLSSEGPMTVLRHPAISAGQMMV